MFDQVPITACAPHQLPHFLGDKTRDLQAERNYYYDISKCGIGYHGDSERLVVVACRLGAAMLLHFLWFHQGEPVGTYIKMLARGVDLDAMIEKASIQSDNTAPWSGMLQVSTAETTSCCQVGLVHSAFGRFPQCQSSCTRAVMIKRISRMVNRPFPFS